MPEDLLDDVLDDYVKEDDPFAVPEDPKKIAEKIAEKGRLKVGIIDVPENTDQSGYRQAGTPKRFELNIEVAKNYTEIIFIIVMCCFPGFAVSYLLYNIANAPELSLGIRVGCWIFLAIFMFVGIWFCTFIIIRQTILSIRGGDITVKRTPAPLVSYHVPLADLAQLIVRWQKHGSSSSAGTWRSYTLRAVTKSGKQITLINKIRHGDMHLVVPLIEKCLLQWNWDGVRVGRVG